MASARSRREKRALQNIAALADPTNGARVAAAVLYEKGWREESWQQYYRTGDRTIPEPQVVAVRNALRDIERGFSDTKPLREILAALGDPPVADDAPHTDACLARRRELSAQGRPLGGEDDCPDANCPWAK